ncbi:hypothetical protein HDV01_007237 [Terramyces sp. JEL0728]|nr:hypothetical protein HDV01_007237 [Terramyces sp. JEL0728]
MIEPSVRYVQTSIVFDYLYFAAGSIAAHLFLIGVVAVGAGVNLYSDVKVASANIRPEKVLNLVRLLVLMFGLSFIIGWSTAGVHSGQYWYTIFRRCVYSLPIFVVVFISLPSIIFFGNQVLETLQKSHSMGNAETEGSAVESSVVKEETNPSPLKVQRPRDAKIATFRLGLNLCIWVVYILTVLNMTCLMFGYEYHFTSDMSHIAVKILGDAAVWTSTSTVSSYMNNNTVLRSICDQRMNYFGCKPETAYLFSMVDTIMLVLNCCSVGCYLYKLLGSMYTGRNAKYKLGPTDKLCVVGIISTVGRIAQMANSLIAYRYRNGLSDIQIIRHFQANVVLEFIFYSSGAIGSNIFLVSVVSAIAGVEMYPDLVVGQRTISPAKILSLVRLSISLLALSVSISWATLGTQALYWYVTFRRFNYLLSVCIIVCISLPVISFFGNKVVKFLESTIAVLEKKRTVYTQGESTLKAADPEICDYRMNYFGCKPEQIHYFAIIDMVLIVLHSCSALAFVSLLLLAILKSRDSKFVFGARDKICVVGIMALLGRIAQLSNARTASYTNMDLPDSAIIRYFQANVMLEFVFYTAGALGSNIFLVGVVSASAGVKLYPDMYVGGKLLSPEKILSLVRLTLLLLSFSIAVSWATAGAWNGVYWYVTFRRFTYLLSIVVVVCISFPVLCFFGLRMNRVIEKTVQVLERPKTTYTVEASTNETSEQDIGIPKLI